MSTILESTLLDDLLDPIVECLTPEVARRLASLHASAVVQSRFNRLAEKCNEGQLSPAEAEQYDALLRALQVVTALQLKARQSLQPQSGRMSVPEYYRGWLRNFPKEPADRMAAAMAAVDAFEACERKIEPSAADLQPLVVAASSPHKLVFETGCNLLVRLAARRPAAQQCLLQMAQDKNATTRFHAVAYLDAKLPEELRLEIVRLALRDRSTKVRQKGIERAEEFRFRGFLPQLDEMQRTESNEAVRRSLALHIPLLRDGYRLERSEDGAGYNLTVRGPGSLGGPFISNEQYSEEFVCREVARLQSAQAGE